MSIPSTPAFLPISTTHVETTWDAAVPFDHRRPAGPSHPTHEPETGLPDAAFVSTFLTYALALTDRRREPLSLLYIELDRLAAIRDLHGADFAHEAMRKVSRTVSGVLRASDVIARLDDGRLAAVLPGASVQDALMIAESIRAAVAATGVANLAMPVLTASIGVATYPDHAGNPIALRSSAAAALADARSQGRDRVAAPSPSPSRHGESALRLAEDVD